MLVITARYYILRKEVSMSRIGLKLIAVFMAGLIAAVAVVNTIAMIMATSMIRTVVKEGNMSGLKTVQSELAEEIFELRAFIEMMDSFDFTLRGNEENADLFWDTSYGSDSEYAAFFDTEGNVYWHSDNYASADLDLNRALAGGWNGFIDDSKAGLALEVCMPIKRDGSTIGVAIMGLYIDNEWLDERKEETGLELTIFKEDVRFSTTIADANGNRAIGTKMAENIAKTVLTEGKSYEGEANILGQNYYVAYEPMPDINGNIIGAYFAGTSSAESDSMKVQLIIITIAAALVVAALSVVATIIVNKKVLIDPIKEASKLAEDMSLGQLRKPNSDFKFANDELGDFMRRLEDTKNQLNNYIGDINYVLSEMATGDFTVQPKVEYIGDFVDIKESFNEIEDSLSSIIGSIGSSSRDVRSGSSQIAEGSQTLADGTIQQAAAIEELSASINDIAEKVQQSALNASEASKISTQTADKITFQNDEVKNMLGAMDEIKEKSDQIQNIIQAIDDIAFQTNILALNAAIEAARAGAAGKGFAVVADEVRNLAAKSAESARQTGDLINATIEAVNKGTVIAESTAETMKQVTALSVQTNSYISDITVATEEQTKAIIQVKVGIDRISQVVNQNSATAEQTAASCEELSTQAAVLESQIKRFIV
ncbi:MAG: cache domain-containing protein [Oscillospiraceae bacterium]|nr:cache domain-containing protein [Oscillospiraceae bacterium]